MGNSIKDFLKNISKENLDFIPTSKENLGEEVAEKLELTDKTDQKKQPKFYNFRANIDESYKDMSVDQIYPSGIETRFYTTASEGGDSGSQNISVVNKVNEQVTNKVTENPVSPVSGTSGAPKNYADGTKTMKNYTCFEVENGIYIEADLNSKKPYLLKDLERANVDKNEYNKIIETCNQADPTGDQANYTQWILRQYIKNGNINLEEYKDILTKFTELKNSKKIQPADLNQYKTFDDLKNKVQDILKETGGATNNRSKKELSEQKGIRKIDQDGDIELFVVNTYEAARKEFEGTGWCVAYPDSYEEYSQYDPNFYFFKKDGKPYLLDHKNDFKGVDDKIPTYEQLKDVANLMIKHNLPNQHNLLEDKIITREDGDLFNQAVNGVIEKGNGLELLINKFITREDGDLFNQVVNRVIEKGDRYHLLDTKIITKEDGDLFNQLVNQAIEEGYGYRLLYFKIITREDGELFDKAVNRAIEKGNGLELLINKIITREDGELFDKAVNRAIEKGNGLDLLYRRIITRENGGLFDKVINGVIEEGLGYWLLKYKVITKENHELFNKLVNEAIKDGYEYYLLENKIITEEELEKYKNNSKDQPEQLQDNTDDTNKTSSLFETINKVAYWEELFGNPFPNAKPSNLDDIGVQLDCNDTTKDTSRDTKKRFTEPSVLPQVYVSNTQEDINKDMMEMENAKYAPHFCNRLPFSVADFDIETITKVAGKKELIQEIKGKKKVSDEEAKNIYNTIANISPDNQSDKNYPRYTHFLVKQYLNGNYNPENTGDNAKAEGGAKLFLDAYKRNLLNSERINNLNFTDFHNTLHKLLGDDYGVEMSLQERVKDTDAKLMNKTKDKEGNTYHLFEVPTSKGVGKLFSGSSWCIRNEDTADSYLNNGKATDGQDHPFFFVTKNGEPYLLHHVLDFRQKHDMIPNDSEDGFFNDFINNTDLDTDYKISNQLPLSKAEVDRLDISDVKNSFKLAYVADEYAKAGKQLPDNYFDNWDGKMAYNLVKYFLKTEGTVPDFVWDKWSSYNKDYELGSILSAYIQAGKQDQIPDHLISSKHVYYSDAITTWLQAGLQVPEQIWENWYQNYNDNGMDVVKWYYNPAHKNKIKELYPDLIDKIEESYNKSRIFNYTITVLSENSKEPFLDKGSYDKLLAKVLEPNILGELEYNHNLLKNKIITEENNKELFDKLVNLAIEKRQGYNLLKDKIVTKADGVLFDKLVDEAIEKGNEHWLLSDKIITKENGELFNQLLDKAIEEGWGLDLLENKVITKADGELFDKLVDKAIDQGEELGLLVRKVVDKGSDKFKECCDRLLQRGRGISLLEQHVITKSKDKEYFDKCVDNAIEKGRVSDLLFDKLITKDDDRFEECVIQYLRDGGYNTDLFFHNVISEEDWPYYVEKTWGNKDTENESKQIEQELNQDQPEQEQSEKQPEQSQDNTDDTNKTSSLFEINKKSDLLGDFNRPWDIPESDNILRNRGPITEVNKKEKDKLKQETKKVHKPIKNIPISMNFPYIEDEMGLNKIYYGDMDWISMTDLSQL